MPLVPKCCPLAAWGGGGFSRQSTHRASTKLSKGLPMAAYGVEDMVDGLSKLLAYCLFAFPWHPITTGPLRFPTALLLP